VALLLQQYTALVKYTGLENEGRGIKGKYVPPKFVTLWLDNWNILLFLGQLDNIVFN
jgi:hypothetical protein